MILERGNMWDVFGKTGLFLITTNPIIRKDGAVVMGRGIAREAALRFPELPFKFGRRLSPEVVGYQASGDSTGTIGTYEQQEVGYFMVKRHWNSPAELSIIEDSVSDLLSWAPYQFWRIDLNFPGIGNGKLRREDVLPIIEKLPDKVHVWEYA